MSLPNVKPASKLTPDERRHWAVRALLFFLAFVFSTVLIVFHRSGSMGPHEFQVGEPAPRSLFSPLDISYVNQGATEELRSQKSASVPAVFRIDAKALKPIEERLGQFFRVLAKTGTEKKKGQRLDPSKLPFVVSEETLKFLTAPPSAQDEARAAAESFVRKNLERGVLDSPEKRRLIEAGTPLITIVGPGRDEKDISVRDVPTPDELKDAGERLLPEAAAKNRGMKNFLLEIFNAVLSPNLVLDEEEMNERRKKAADAAPPVYEQIKKDELVVQRGMLVTTDQKRKIDQIQKKLAEHKALNQILAAGLLVFLTYLLMFIYLFSFERKMLRSMRMVLLILTVFLAALAVCKTAASWPGVSIYMMPAALAPLLLVLLIPARIGVLSSVAIAALTAPLSGFSPEVILGTLLAGFAGTLAAAKVRKRIEFLKVGAVIGLSYVAVVFAFRIFQEYPVQESFHFALQALANGFITTTVCFLIFLPLLEWIFNLTTDITLLELSDLNHPLLKRMIIEAPGTYHHSLVVSTLAESACEAIGANALLARVGCYFHDIGKIARSEFFTENQTDKSRSVHHKMTPTMSCLLIMNHVKEGMELGRKQNLKDRILRFIPEHHGTGVIYYFYKKALDAAGPGGEVNADDFRYPGPRPQSRETAVALLADSTEAASRSMKNPTPDSIRQLVRKIINDKFIDGQLDECDLTLRDLHRIQESFVHNLMAIFHTRVAYPAAAEDPDRPDLFEEGQFSKYRFDPLK